MCVLGLCVGVFMRHSIYDSPLNLDLTLATACPPEVGSKFKVESSNIVRDNHFTKHCIG